MHPSQYEFHQPQTRAHVALIYRNQYAHCLSVKQLIKDATHNVSSEDIEKHKVPEYAIRFFTHEIKRLIYALTNGVYAVWFIKNSYDAELFFQCENNRSKEMELVDMLKVYHLRIALAAEKSDKAVTPQTIKDIWKTLTESQERYERFRKTVIGLLLIRLAWPIGITGTNQTSKSSRVYTAPRRETMLSMRN